MMMMMMMGRFMISAKERCHRNKAAPFALERRTHRPEAVLVATYSSSPMNGDSHPRQQPSSTNRSISAEKLYSLFFQSHRRIPKGSIDCSTDIEDFPPNSELPHDSLALSSPRWPKKKKKRENFFFWHINFWGKEITPRTSRVHLI